MFELLINTLIPALLVVAVLKINALRSAQIDLFERKLSEFHEKAHQLFDLREPLPDELSSQIMLYAEMLFQPGIEDRTRASLALRRKCQKKRANGEQEVAKLSARQLALYDEILEIYINLLTAKNLISGYRLLYEVKKLQRSPQGAARSSALQAALDFRPLAH